MNNDYKTNKCVASILGFVIGDALGVPVEFMTRMDLKNNSVTDMRSYGTHSQPAGTWSDDTSMVVATIEWLGELDNSKPDYNVLMDKFNCWLLYGDYRENVVEVIFIIIFTKIADTVWALYA